MHRIMKENRRSGGWPFGSWEAAAVFGFKLVALSCLAQTGLCGSSSTKDISSRLTQFHLLTTRPFEAAPDASEACRRDTEVFHKGLADLEMWAVQMYDSAGKPSSGLIRGNTHQFGDYEECIEAHRPGDAHQGSISGQYCLINVFVEQADKSTSERSRRIEDILDNALSHSAVRSTFDNTPSFFPTFTPMSWGLCVPSTCSDADVVASVNQRLSPINGSSSGLNFRIKIEKGACEVKKQYSLTPGSVYAISLIATVVLFAIAGTIFDIKTTKKVTTRSVGSRVLLAYSIRRNLRELFRTDKANEEPTAPADDIGCLHGIRAIFSLSIYIIHRMVFGLFIPYTNRTYVAELFEGEWTMIFRAFWNNVDTFVILSGLLTSFFAIKKLQEGKGMNIPRMYLQRYFKFTPIFLVIVLFVGQLTEHTGPQDMRVINHFVTNCRGPWVVAKTLLYANNFNGMENMCYPPSHQLVTDMQMYLSAPFFILLLWKWPKRGPIIVLAIVAALASYKYAIIYTSSLNSVIFHGVSVSEMTLAARLVYLNPVHRLTPYLFGIGLGYLLRRTKGETTLGKGQLFAGWCLACYTGYYSFFGAKGAASRGYVADIGAASLFGALQPILWSFTLGWVIYVCHVGKAGMLNRFLSWKGFEVFSRLSYSVYMVQIVVIFFNIGTVMTPKYFSISTVIDLNEIAAVLSLSVVLTVLFLMPFIELWKIMNGLEMKVRPPGPENETMKKSLDFTKDRSIATQDLRASCGFTEKNADEFSRNT
ncbi:nose resistant to fluoxetine protein 6-like [Ischnura elegans]|uniref:nose resistant to fluoxetine protein 6-like n=1 Tax=Ischnura elegans TaxID=197161 RepID=UPI001ED87525|nr:nose resistant to fluoxetine protein 6-like [Ischnura elegans]